MSFYSFLPKLINMSLTASVAIVLVILLRLLLKKAPKVISYALWGVVLFRLLCPISIGSSLSLYNLLDAPTEETGTLTSVMEYVPENIVHTEYPSVVLPVPGVSEVINDTLPQGEEQLRADPLEGPVFIATYVWGAGVLVMVIYGLATYIRLRRKLLIAVRVRDNIYLADGITSPFVLGLFRPKIYLPSTMEEKEQSYILLHEQHHIRRGDHIVKALAFAALCIHWFNPLVWAAFILSGKDMEMSCDEAVVKKMGEGVLADYTASLLSLATGKHIIAGMPLAFGEGNTKGRIHNLANWKKPAFWVVLVAAVACLVLAVCLLTNPSDASHHAPEPFCHAYRVGRIIYQDTRYSFGYTRNTTPQYQLTSDYQLFVAGDAFDGSDSGEWVQHHGAFKDIKLSGLRFDDYFKDPGNLSGWDGARYGAESIREQTKQAWRLDVEDSESGVFYYLILTHTDDVFLCYGYDVGNNHAAAEEGSLIRWIFELERTDLLKCNAVSDGNSASIELAYFPDTDIDRDTGNWPVAYVNESGTLQFSVEADASTLVVSEDYYRKGENSTFIERNNLEIARNEDGLFTMDIARRESLEDHVNYFIKIKGQSDVYAMKVVFKPVNEPSQPKELTADELIPGTAYVSYQCIYMNPLSSYWSPGGDSGYRYIINENSFVIISQNDGHIVSISSNPPVESPAVDTGESVPARYEADVEKWKWQEFPYTDEEWAALYVPGGFGAMKGIGQLYDEILYQPIEKNRFLLRVDGDLWLVELRNNDRMGTYLWSIYSLIPESAMGVAQWEYAPMLSSRSPVFPFTFDMDYTEISAVCVDGLLVDWETPGKTSDHNMTFKKGVPLCWSPQDEDALRVSRAAIQFTVLNGDENICSGTLYIEGAGGNSDGRPIYTASIVGTGLHLEPNPEQEGGIITLVDSNMDAHPVVEHDLTISDIEATVDEIDRYVFYTNSTQIAVEVESDADFDGKIVLVDISQNNAEILEAKVSSDDNDCLFTGLTSARRYKLSCEGLDGCTLTVSGND